ncbi:arylamine N-acetyltransferase [Streptomyces sp. RKND-216]|uniref:arylamine N-acetyltransferase family protein n=1 Tax=Streptomyces sp. RKND-216 TaxID=2562581 RepID=UPI00109DE50B|nr:arylamine N-acetyltransferase [Streptomyces sp. RKND-216]THA23671.1 arylamine N-acetyltransferase [Streptomyces sp. RKND-216]
MDNAAVAAYLQRIGAERPEGATAEALRDLHRRHLTSVPFENLSIHLGEDIVLADEALVDKIVGGRRGGFCYELNGAFAALLDALGYRVTRLAARVFSDGRPGIPYDHLALRVEAADGSAWLADVGFGKHSHHPLDLAGTGDQHDPGGTFRLVPAAEGDLDVLQDGSPQYRLEQRARELRDFEVGCWYNRTSPRSHFTRSLVCSRLTEEGGRATLSGRNLVLSAPDGRREERELADQDEVLAAYRDHFGLALDREPVLLSASRP